MLGVRVDPQLSWKPHVDKLEDKVKKVMRYLRSISSSVRGLDLIAMRQVYLAMVQTIMTYAAPAWAYASWGPKGCLGISKAVLKRLDRLQQECLRFISGAFAGTPHIVILKELFLHNISDILHIKAVEHHAIMFHTTHVEQLRGPAPRSNHPFHAIDIEARHLCHVAKARFNKKHDPTGSRRAWDNPDFRENRKRAIKKEAKKQLNHLSEAAWEAYRAKPRSIFGMNNFAAGEPWGPKNLDRYRKLDRKQSTMLLQCRTGRIGLQSHLFLKKRASQPTCPRCCRAPETVAHLFLHCKEPTLVAARHQLFEETGQRDLSLNLAHHPVQAANFPLA